MIKLFCGVFLLLALSIVQGAPAKDENHALAENKIKLAKELAKGYEKLVEPGNTTLKIGMSITCAHYDKRKKLLHTRVFERYAWNDWRLVWNPSKYGGVRVLKIPISLIWKPDDIRLFNAFHESPERDDVNAVILFNGTVYWVPTASYESLCGPGEKVGDKKGHCHFSLGSWTYDADDLPLVLFEGGADTKFYLDSCPHVITNLKSRIKHTKYECCPGPYASLEVDFDLEERDWDVDDHLEVEKKVDKHHQQVDCKWPHC